MGKHSRDKGKRGEREACEVLRPIFPDVRRRAMQARGGQEGADLDNTPGYHVEVGVGNVNPRAKWEQAVNDVGCDPTCLVEMDCGAPCPIALTRKDRGEWLVTMSAEHFATLVRKADTNAQDAPGREQDEGRGKGRVGT